MELTYTETSEGYLMPDLAAPMQTEPDIGTWGRRRKAYLKANRKGMYAVMKTEGTLFLHLAQVNQQAEAMWARLIEQMAERQAVTSDLKRENQMEWVGRMNNIRQQAAEVVCRDLIYS
jgi:hypothetical protein